MTPTQFTELLTLIGAAGQGAYALAVLHLVIGLLTKLSVPLVAGIVACAMLRSIRTFAYGSQVGRILGVDPESPKDRQEGLLKLARWRDANTREGKHD